MSEVSTITKYGKVYAFSNIINRASGLILIPIYTHMFDPKEFGVYAIIIAITDMLSLVFGMGFTSAMTRLYFDYDLNDKRRLLVISTTVFSFIVVACLVMVLSYPACSILSELMFETTEYAGLFKVAIMGLLFSILYEIELGFEVIRKKVWVYFSLSLMKAVTMISVNLYLLFILDMGIDGLIYSTAISLGLISILALVPMLFKTGLGFSVAILRKILSFGLPLVPSAVANAGLTVAERYFINYFLGASAVGVYALVHRLASLLQLFVATPFAQIFVVRRFETLVENKDQGIFNEILMIFVMVVSFFLLGMAIFSMDILYLIASKEYMDGVVLMPLLGVCYVLSSLNMNIEIGIFYTKKTTIVPIIGVVTLLISLPLYYWLIPELGMIGAAVALILVNSIRLFLTVIANYYVGTRSVSLDWVKAIVLISCCTIVGLYGTTLDYPPWDIYGMLIKTVIYFSACLFLLFSPLITNEIRRKIRFILFKK